MLRLYFSILLKSMWGLFKTLKDHYLMYESIRNSIVSAIGMYYVRGLNCRKRYHMRELMSFRFIFVTNFICDKNPLYGIKVNYTVLSSSIHSNRAFRMYWNSYIDRTKQTYAHIVNTLIEHSSNKILTSMLFILKHNGKLEEHNRRKFWEYSKSILDNFLSIFDWGLPPFHWDVWYYKNILCKAVQ